MRFMHFLVLVLHDASRGDVVHDLLAAQQALRNSARLVKVSICSSSTFGLLKRDILNGASTYSASILV